ncbi:MAG: hypothetical protein ACFFDL_15750 [Promethearchaeota archaeon]
MKFITELENHWITIQKYLNIFDLTQKYCPKIELDGSKLRVIKSEIYRRLSEKEKLILYLFNNQALTPESAKKLPENIDASLISKSIGYLFKKINDDNFYLTKSGLEFYRYFKENLSDLIYNDKDISEVFGSIEEIYTSSQETEESFNLAKVFLEEKSIMVTIGMLTSLSASSSDIMYYSWSDFLANSQQQIYPI